MGQSNIFYIYDHKYNFKFILDIYESMIWIERYSDVGDFEIMLAFDPSIVHRIQLGDYIELIDRSHALSYKNIMMVDSININNDTDNHNIIIKGQSHTKILKQRQILFDTVIPSGTDIKNGLLDIINNSLLYQSNYLKSQFNYEIPSEYSNLDMKIKVKWNVGYSATLKDDFPISKGSLFDTVKKVCDFMSWGFRVVLDDSNNQILEIYSGEDREIILSKSFDNVISSVINFDARNFYNAYMIMGDKYDSTDYSSSNDKSFKKYQKVKYGNALYQSLIDNNTDSPSSSNWEKIPWYPFYYKVYNRYPGMNSDIEALDPNDIYTHVYNSNIKDYIDINGNSNNRVYFSHQAMINLILQDYIINNPSAASIDKKFEPQIYLNNKYKYGSNYRLGDIVTFIDDLAGISKGRIIEFIRTFNGEGYREYPTITIQSE